MAQDDLEKVLAKVIDQKVMPELKAIKTKLVEHDKQFVRINEKLDEHDKQFVRINEKLDEHDQQFVSIDKQFVRINVKLDATMEMTAKNSEDITMMKIDIAEMQEDVSDTNFTAQRIESTLNVVVQDQDSQDLKTRQLNRRVLKLESKRS